MSNTSHHHAHHVDIDGYVANELADDEARSVRRHVERCTDCGEEVRSLRAIRDALGEVPPEALLDGPPDDADLVLQRALRQVRAEASRGRVRRAAVVGTAAAVAVAAVLGIGVLVGRAVEDRRLEAANPPRPSPSSASPTAVQPGTRFASELDATTGARLTVRVTPAAGWVRLNAAVTGIPEGQRCLLIVVDRDGGRQIAGGWLVSRLGAVDGTTLDGAALVAPSDVAAVVVENTDGRRFVEAAL